MDKLRIIKKTLNNRILKTDDEIIGDKCVVTFKINVFEQIKMSNYLGEGFGLLYDLTIIDIESAEGNYNITRMLRNFFREIFDMNKGGLDGKSFESLFWSLTNGVSNESRHFIKLIGVDDRFILKLNHVDYLPNETESLNEHKMSRSGIRSIIKDIVKILKYEDEGSYNLPEDINGEHFYDFSDIKSQFNVELKVKYDESIKEPNLDGGYYEEEDVITVDVTLNPMNIKQSMYNVIGELNDIMAHELEHLNQSSTGSHDLTDTSEGNPLTYYSQPHEVDAQKKGFTRLSKLIRQPYENVVRNWFDTHKSTHKMNNDEVVQVIDLLV